jgi:hypothetical protein
MNLRNMVSIFILIYIDPKVIAGYVVAEIKQRDLKVRAAESDRMTTRAMELNDPVLSALLRGDIGKHYFLHLEAPLPPPIFTSLPFPYRAQLGPIPGTANFTGMYALKLIERDLGT